MTYNEEYIGESARTFWERFKEHLKTSSPIYDYQSRAGHTSIEHFNIVAREGHNLAKV